MGYVIAFVLGAIVGAVIMACMYIASDRPPVI